MRRKGLPAERGWVDAIVEPRDTRPTVIAALR
jgi:acetyl-CoA carboxylase carboxyltransferase component